MYDKKKLIILRAALIVAGAAIGFAAMWQYFAVYPDVMRQEFRIVVTVVSSAALALLLGLSAKPVYRFGASVATTFMRLVSPLGALGAAAAVTGFVAAGATAYLFDFLISNVLAVLAVRILLDILVYAISAAVFCYAFTRYIASGEAIEAPDPDEKRVGYLFTASCFFDDRVFAAADVLINAKAEESLFKALWRFGDTASLERLKKIERGGKLGIIRGERKYETPEEYAKGEADVAAQYRLAPLAFETEAFPAIPNAVSLETFAYPLPPDSSKGASKAPKIIDK